MPRGSQPQQLVLKQQPIHAVAVHLQVVVVVRLVCWKIHVKIQWGAVKGSLPQVRR